jgi:hypothetical protein
MYKRSLPPSLTFSLDHTLTHSHSIAHSHTHSLTHTPSLILTHTICRENIFAAHFYSHSLTRSLIPLTHSSHSISLYIVMRLQVEGLLFTESKNVTKSDGEIDIGCGNSFGGGGEDDAGASEAQSVNNFIDAFQLTETQIGTANDLKGWLKVR